MNNVTIIGRLIKDPEIRYYQKADGSQGINARFIVACDRDRETSDFISCVAYAKAAELMQQYFHKGNRIGITGSIVTGSYTNKDGATVYTTDVMVSRIDFCESAQSDPGRVSAAAPNTNYQQQQTYYQQAPVAAPAAPQQTTKQARTTQRTGSRTTATSRSPVAAAQPAPAASPTINDEGGWLNVPQGIDEGLPF